MKQGRSLNRAFLPGQAVAPPGEQADLADLEARVGVLEAYKVAQEAVNADFETRISALENARTSSDDLPPPQGQGPEPTKPVRQPRVKHT
jgi:hypothetical protein